MSGEWVSATSPPENIKEVVFISDGNLVIVAEFLKFYFIAQERPIWWQKIVLPKPPKAADG